MSNQAKRAAPTGIPWSRYASDEATRPTESPKRAAAESVLHAAPKRAAVLGHPIAHSLSPVLHRAAYAALGLDGWTYDAIDVTAEQLPAFIAGLDGTWVGLSLTMPLKRAIIPLVDRTDATVKQTGVANTVLFISDRRYAFNTDVYGIQAAIREVIRHGPIENAAILGNGATAVSALAALSLDFQELTGVTETRGLSCKDITVFARAQDDPEDFLAAADRLGISVTRKSLDDAAAALPEYDVVISTMPAHAADRIAAELSAAGGLLLDVIYDPRPTDLQAAWSALGGAIVGGERMLLHQAEAQVGIFGADRNDPAETQAYWDGVALRAMDQALQAALAED